MPLYIIGLGLYDEYDITVRGLQIVKECAHVYLEGYTSILLVETDKLERFYNKKVTVLDRTAVEQQCGGMLQQALSEEVAFMVVGDPFCATTHADLVLRARAMGVEVKVVHNASIMNGVAACGLQLYRFGETVSIPWFQDQWRPTSFYDKIKANRSIGLHTLCLLDIKVKEQTIENLMRGNDIFEPPRYMTVSQAIAQLLEIEGERKEGVCLPHFQAFAIARLGSLDDQMIVSGTLAELSAIDLGAPLHSLALCAPELHEIEEQFLKLFSCRTAEEHM